LGVEKPGGCVPRLIVVVPPARGSNWTVVNVSPPLKTAGLLTIVPTVGSELVTATLTFDRPPRTSCPSATLSVVGFSRAALTVRVVFGEEAVVVKLLAFR